MGNSDGEKSLQLIFKFLGLLVGILVMGSSLAAPLSLIRPKFQALRVDESERLVCRASDFGATGNGEDYDTSAIQSSIDYCAQRGGGVVRIPPGTYLTGTLYLKSNITLWVDEGATILGSTRQEDFPAQWTRWYTILAEDAENVELTGGGIVTGQGLKFVEEFKEEKNIMVSWNVTGDCVGDECRPRLVGFVNCKNVHIWNVFLEEPAYWCLHVVNSDIVSIHDVSIHGDFNSPNTDGIDIDSSNNTVIKDCHIDTGDDAICPKTVVGPLNNLSVTNCWIRTKSCAVKLGSQTNYDLSNLHFEQLMIVDSHRGLGIQLRDRGNVNNVTYANIEMSTRYYHSSWWGFAEPIYITACPRSLDTVLGSVNDVHYINITTTSENGIFLSGLEESFLKGLHFRNVNVTLVRWTNFSGGHHDYRPGCQGLVMHRMSGLFMEYVEDIWMQKVVLLWKGYETTSEDSENGAADQHDVRYGLTDASKYLVTGSEFELTPYHAMMQRRDMQAPLNHLREAVEDDTDGFVLANGTEIWTYGSANLDFNDAFNAAMQSRSRLLNTIIVRCYEGFKDVKCVVNVGGGVGGALTQIVAAHPHIEGINFDLPHVISTAPKISGIEHVSGDFFEFVPSGEAILLQQVLHDWGDEESIQILKICYKAFPQNGKVLIHEHVIDPSKISAAKTGAALNSDVLMLALCRGRGKKEPQTGSVSWKGPGSCWISSSSFLSLDSPRLRSH